MLQFNFSIGKKIMQKEKNLSIDLLYKKLIVINKVMLMENW